jgi:membrane protein DedA with SNARE-associated domain
MDWIALGGIVGLLFVKETGVPIPVPGDLVVLTAGVAAASGSIDPVVGLVAIVVAGIAGGIVQFGLVRGPGRRGLLSILRRFGVPEGRIEEMAARLGRRGATGVAVARMTPGVRVVAIAAAAIAAIQFGRFAIGLAIGNAVFVGGHYALGFAVGKPAIALVSSAASAVVAVVALAIVGGLGWWLIGRRRAQARASVPIVGASPSAASWADAACPACLLLAAVRPDPILRLRPDASEGVTG